MKTYTVKEAAKYCKCHPETIREHIRSGALAASKPGRAYCIKAAVLDAFLDALQNHTVQASLEHRSEQKCQSIQEKTVFWCVDIKTAGGKAGLLSTLSVRMA